MPRSRRSIRVKLPDTDLIAGTPIWLRTTYVFTDYQRSPASDKVGMPPVNWPVGLGARATKA